MNAVRDAATSTLVRGRVVAVLLTHGDLACLLRRSNAVAFDRGRWHCVTGFLPAHVMPARQAVIEVNEETGLRSADLNSLVAGRVLRLADSRGGVWIVHTYRCEIARRELSLNWENDQVRWVPLTAPGVLPVVEWLPDVAAAVGIDTWNARMAS